MDVVGHRCELLFGHLFARPVDDDMSCLATRFKPFNAELSRSHLPFNQAHGIQLGQALDHSMFVIWGGKGLGQAMRPNRNGVVGMARSPGVDRLLQWGQRRRCGRQPLQFSFQIAHARWRWFTKGDEACLCKQIQGWAMCLWRTWRQVLGLLADGDLCLVAQVLVARAHGIV